MYESPISETFNNMYDNIARQITEDHENRLMAVVQSVVNIDKDELIKALKYDRDQYNKGYQDAMNDARCTAKWLTAKDGHYYCSNCDWSDRHKDNFCPHCGAYMGNPYFDIFRKTGE